MTKRIRAIHAAPLLAALTAAAVLGVAPAAHAKPAPGDNGDVKIHKTTTAVTDERNNPKVCRFYLDAFNFDTIQNVSWVIHQQPPTGHSQVLSGTLTLTNGTGHTGTLGLPNGHYKLNWTFTGEKGSAKHKVFKVSCPPGRQLPPGTTIPPGEHETPPPGEVEAGFGSTVQGPSSDELAAGSALLVAGAAGVGTVLLRRRRGTH